MLVKEFKGRYKFLSNFFYSPITINGLTYNTVEHWFHSQKTENPEEQEMIRKVSTPALAKKKGRSVALRKDWEDIKLEIMEKGLIAKFKQHPDLAQKLLDTKDDLLQEGNRWGDSFWGINLDTNKGSNHLGKLLIRIRTKLKQGDQVG